MQLKQWGAFWLLGFVWGSAFLWIKIGVGYLPPFTFAALRQIIGLAGLLAVAALWKQALPRDPARLGLYAIQGTLQAGLPFALIAWGETRIGSGNVWGATRASAVTYVFPVVGLILGIAFLGEHLDARLALGSLLVVAGIAVVGRAPLGRPIPAPEAAAEPCS